MTSDSTMKPYEGMFLFPQAQAGDLQHAVDLLKGILEKSGATLISLRKWDERRLAYEVKGNKRGVYFLVYFHASPDKLAAIERACNLSEQLLRSMIIRADHMTQEEMEAADGAAELADEIKLRAQEAAESGDRAETPDAGPAEEPVTVETEAGAKNAATT